MNKAMSKLPISEEESSKQTAIIIPLHSVKKATPKRRYQKKAISEKNETGASLPAPYFTSAIFHPRKHDLL